MNRAPQGQSAASDVSVAGAQPAAAHAGSQTGASVARQAGLLETARAVMWSFFGVRGRSAHESDLARLNPLYVILMGIVLAVSFVVGLVTLVRFIVS